jgi:hypothetical protein
VKFFVYSLISFLYRTRLAFRKEKFVKFFIYSVVKIQKSWIQCGERRAGLLRESLSLDIEEVGAATGPVVEGSEAMRMLSEVRGTGGKLEGWAER